MGKINPGTVEGANINFTPTGLSTDYRITTMDVTDTASAIPAAPLASRVAISITNLHATEVLYLGKITVTADRVNGTTSGWEVGAGESFNVDITDSIIIYGIAEAGQTIPIKVLEIS